MVRGVKLALLKGLRAVGAYDVVLRSGWRSARVAILCYHGVSIDDEHAWDRALYMRPSMFDQRLRLLRDGGYRVLTLSEAARRLYEGSLPPRSVCLTFDDGGADFVLSAQPLLEKYGFPATVYLTTYYSELRAPVFDTVVRYILWKSGRETVDAKPYLGIRGSWTASTREGRVAGLRQLGAHCERLGMSGADKAELAARLAGNLGVDYDRILSRRLLQIMTPEEAADMVRRGVDIQLHTHRHRSPEDKETFLREIEDNRERVRSYVGYDPVHFCYPMAICRPQYPGWLRETTVQTATITAMALASRGADPYRMPRVVDVESMHPVEFEAYLTGARSLLPRRGAAR